MLHPIKQLISILPLGVLFSIFAFTSNGRAADAKAPPPPPKHTVIAVINSESITVDTGNNVRIFKIDKYTRFFYLGSETTLNDMKPGMRVSVTPTFDGKTAAVINAGVAPKVAPAAPAQK